MNAHLAIIQLSPELREDLQTLAQSPHLAEVILQLQPPTHRQQLVELGLLLLIPEQKRGPIQFSRLGWSVLAALREEPEQEV